MRRFFAICLTAALLLGLMIPVANAADTGTADEQQIAFLQAMGFIKPDSDADFGASRLLRRGELARLLCGVAGIAPAAVTQQTALYADLTGAHADAAYIKAVVDAGMMSPGSDGRFWANSPVTLSDACFAFASLAGYHMFLERRDPLVIAAGIGIYDGNVPTGDLTKGQVAYLLYRTLHVSYFDQTVYGTEASYEIASDYLVLEAVCKVIYAKGIVTGENGSTLTHPDEFLKDGRIQIDGVAYTGAPQGEHLGSAVEYYYRKTNDTSAERELLYLQEDGKRNEYLTLKASQIEDASLDQLTYREQEEDQNTQTVLLPVEIDVIYNGVAYPGWTPDDLQPDYGSVQLIDNNRDGDYDVAIVTSYTFFIAGYINSAQLKLYDQFNSAMLDLSANDITYEVWQSGEQTRFSRIKKNQLIAVAASKNTAGKRKFVLTVGATPVKGRITSISEQDITVDTTEVRLSDALYDTLSGNAIRLGEERTFYLWDGEVVRMEEQDATYDNIAYLVNVMAGTGLDSSLTFRVVQKKTTFNDLDGAERITVDGVRYSDGQKVLEALAKSAQRSNYSADYPYAQPIEFWQNDRGEIYKIDTVAYDAANETDDSLIHSEPAMPTVRYVAANRSMYANNALVASVPTSARTIWIPLNRRYDADYYNVVGGGGFNNRTSYIIEPFFQQENKAADVIFVYYQTRTAVAATAKPAIVTKVSDALVDGEETRQIVYQDTAGKTGTLKLASDINCPELRVGDVIRYRTNYAGFVIGIDRCFSPYNLPGPNGRITSYESGTNDYGATQNGYAGIYGTVLYRENNFITLTTSIAADDNGIAEMANVDNYLADSTRFVKLEKRGGAPRVVSGSFNELIPYSMDAQNASEVYLFVVNDALSLVYLIDLEE